MKQTKNKGAKYALQMHSSLSFFARFLHRGMVKTNVIFLQWLWPILVFSLISCAPQREFVHFEDAGTFHPGPGQGNRRVGPPSGEYDSYELIDHGAPNQGIAPMYQGNQQPAYGGDYQAVQQGFDQYGNPVNVVVPRPW
jgi:hypothetical protein